MSTPPFFLSCFSVLCCGEQGGEFAFVAFGMAERLGIIEPQLCKLLLTTVAISMAATPALSNFSAWVADQVCVRVLLWFSVDRAKSLPISVARRQPVSASRNHA